MRQSSATAILFLGVFLISGCTDADERTRTSANTAAVDPAIIDDGHEIAIQQCARCHAVEPTGLSPNPQAPVFRTIFGRYDRDVLERELIEGIRVSHEPMPTFDFDPKGVDALIAYLESIQVTTRGARLIEEKCARCHAIGSSDTSPYPGAQPFRNLGARWTRANLAEALRTGILAEHDASGVRLEMKLSDAEIDDFLNYLDGLATSDHPSPR